MTMIRIVALCLWLVGTQSLPLNPKMFQADSVDELNRATSSFEAISEGRRLQEEVSGPKLAAGYDGPAGFYHGVASGDPLPDAVIIWTRWTPETEVDEVMIEFRMAQVDSALALEDHLDPSRNSDIHTGVVKVTGATDWSVKLDIKGLEPQSSYVYGFVGPDGETSRVGLTKTAPALDADVEQLQYAVFSCAHFSNGYFHAYDVASTLTELDFWVHVGDYIYEYGTYSNYASSAPERKNLTDPVWEIVELQDYRLRYAQYHRDEGLLNLRARAPLIATWDDHETMNDSYGDGSPEGSGAENHQETCPANRTSPIEEKQDANCDIDEGPILERLNHAAQAYMEWMPLRKGSFGNMGAVNTDLTQVIEWGNLATLVVLDSRVSERSEEPAGTTHFGAFAPAFANLNVSTYTEEPALSEFTAIHDAVMEEINNPSYTMIGSKTEFLRETFAASKAAGKPWQIYGAATMVGPSVPPNLHTLHQLVNPPELAGAVKQVTDATLAAPSAGTLRAAAAMAITGTPWNGDDYNGYGAERAKLLDICKTDANNCIILGGDLHDAWAWQLYEGGSVEKGNPVAVNLGTSGVSSPGWEGFLQSVFAPISDRLGGYQAVNELINAGFEDANPGLVFGSVGRRGFFVVTAKKEEAHVNYFGFDANTMLTDFDAARDNSLTAPFTCDAHLVTTAGDPGSLIEVEDACGALFDTERPAFWSIPLPANEGGYDADSLSSFEDCGMDACLVATADLASVKIEAEEVDVDETEVQNFDDDWSGGAVFGVIFAFLAAFVVALFVYHKSTAADKGVSSQGTAVPETKQAKAEASSEEEPTERGDSQYLVESAA